MESIIVLVGFLGAGKTTLLKRLVNHYLYGYWNPYVILNDYQNAQMDAQYFLELLNPKQIDAISGSCICCSGINELRQTVNNIPKRDKGITFVEANGTTDACTLLGFLGVGLKEHFLPPVQIAVVDARNWQQRGDDNELEANQVQASSMVVLNYADAVDEDRLNHVKSDIAKLNPSAVVTLWNDLNAEILPQLNALKAVKSSMAHEKSHWSSCSVDLPDPIPGERLEQVLNDIPKSVLRLKGCTRLNQDEHYSFFERTPTGEVFFRPFTGKLVSGPKLLAIGPGSDPASIDQMLKKMSVDNS